MAYNPNEFSPDEVKALLTAVKESTKDTSDSLDGLVYDLQQIRSHCTYLIAQCEDRVDELLEEEEDEDGSSDKHHNEV